MYILLFIINIGFGVWLSIGHSFWTYCLNIILVFIAMCAVCTSTVQAIASGRSILSGHVLGLILSLIAFRSHLLIFPLWMLLQISSSFYCAWEDELIGHGKYRQARERRAKTINEIRQLRKQDKD
jgi:high-affinity nickel permease